MKKFSAILLAFTLVFMLSACQPEEVDTIGPALDQAKTDLVLDNISEVTTDLTLPTTVNDATVVWTSSNTSVLTSDGQIIPPSYNTGDVTVTLTAFITYEGRVTTKTFDVTVKASDITDAERVQLALDAIPDIPDVLNESMELPTVVEGAVIEWSSNNPDYVSNTGEVTRPHYDYSDETAVLTAYVSAGKELRLFKKTVTIEKMPYAQHGAVEQQFTVKITNKDGHELYVPYNMLNAPEINIWNSKLPYIYTRDTGLTEMPTFTNDWGIIVVVDGGIITEIYDGISGPKKIKKLEEDGTTTETLLTAETGTYSEQQVTIPEDGAVLVFYNSGLGNDKNGRNFGTTYMMELGAEASVENTGEYVKLTGGVFWRGFTDVYVPIDELHFNPDPEGFDWSQLTNFDDNGTPDDTSDDTVLSAAPAIYTPAYGDTVDVKHGWGIITVVRPEQEETQDIGKEGESQIIELTNQWEVFAVYDGIGAGYKEKGQPTVSLDSATYGSNVQIPEDGYVIVWPNNGLPQADDALNRRIAADYWYHVENWIWDYALVSEDDVPATYPVKGVMEPS